MRTLLTAASVIVTLSVFAAVSEADTAAPSVKAFGWDDFNTSTLSPFGATYLTATPSWLNSALPNSFTQNNVGWNFNIAAQWTFAFAPSNSLVASSTVQSFVYTAWVVSNDGYKLPNGNPAQTATVTGDVGGANFTLNYVPGANDPGGSNSNTALSNVHFFQIVQLTSNYGNDQTGQVASTVTQNFIDNNGNANSPWYDGNFTFGYAQNNTQKWMDDTPYNCENQSGGSCNADGTPNLLSSTWLFNTFIAVDLGANQNTQNNVALYGGLQWGFTYTDTDTPEPSTFAMAAIGLSLGIAGCRCVRAHR